MVVTLILAISFNTFNSLPKMRRRIWVVYFDSSRVAYLHHPQPYPDLVPKARPSTISVTLTSFHYGGSGTFLNELGNNK
jgi:hypothetical protein